MTGIPKIVLLDDDKRNWTNSSIFLERTILPGGGPRRNFLRDFTFPSAALQYFEGGLYPVW
jgi:hypothetical protein